MPKKIVIDGVIGWDIWGSQVRKDLDGTKDELVVEISSPGGSVFDGIEIFNLLRDYSRNVNKVTIKIIGLAASMASYIALAGDNVIAEDNAVFMIHNVWNIAGGDHRELRKTADVLDELSNVLAKTYVKKTGKGLKEIRDLMNNETWLFGSDMVDAGFVDSIIESENKDGNSQNMLLTLAKGRVENCFAMMEKSERSKNDMKKAAALLINPENKIDNTDKTEIIDPELQLNNMEVKNNMDELQKLQSRINELESENKSLKDENEDIQAHLEYAEIAPNEVMTNIKNKVAFSAKIHAAQYGKIQLNAELTNNRSQDNVGDTNTTQSENGETESETNAYIAALKKRRGIK